MLVYATLTLMLSLSGAKNNLRKGGGRLSGAVGSAALKKAKKIGGQTKRKRRKSRSLQDGVATIRDRQRLRR